MKLPETQEDWSNFYDALIIIALSCTYMEEQHEKGEVSDEEFNEFKKTFNEFVDVFEKIKIGEPPKPQVYGLEPNPNCCCCNE